MASMKELEDDGRVRLLEVDAGELLERAASGELFHAQPSPLQERGAALGDDLVVCGWCRLEIEEASPGQVYCSQRCRQCAFRLRKRIALQQLAATPLRFGYADPPYPGFAKRLYGDQVSFAGEVDHAQLVASLVDRYDGWALSTGAYALREVLPLCPAGVRVCAWVKPIGANSNTLGLHNCWEPLIVWPGRRLRPGVRDWVAAQPARGGGDLIGRKPIAFCAFLFQALGMLPGDSLDDLFPGTGIVGLAWASLAAAGDATKKGNTDGL